MDQRSEARIFAGIVDLGAYEWVSTLSSAVTISAFSLAAMADFEMSDVYPWQKRLPW
ncbi:MAG: hypothetical protein AAGG51_27665 [Cyanobacteria bacterium P01_G01_bin.54]